MLLGISVGGGRAMLEGGVDSTSCPGEPVPRAGTSPEGRYQSHHGASISCEHLLCVKLGGTVWGEG